MAVKVAGQRFQRTIETDWDKMVLIHHAYGMKWSLIPTPLK
jgi:hypothetical protein